MLGVVLILSYGIGWTLEGWPWGVLAGLLLLFSLESFYLPTKYRVTEAGIAARRLFFRGDRPWPWIRRVYEDADGLTLSPFVGGSRWEGFRSFRLHFEGGEASEIRDQVRTGCAPEVEWIKVGT